jgi:adenylate cyclase
LALAAFASAYLGDEYEAAMEIADRAMALNPNSHAAWNARGWVCVVAGRWEEAIESFERAIRMSPVDPRLNRTLNGMALALIELGRFEEAAVVSKKSIRQHPSFAAGYRPLASALAHLGRDGEAREAATRLMELEPGFTISAWVTRTQHSNSRRIIEGLCRAGLPE